jgi:hypothetical protein
MGKKVAQEFCKNVSRVKGQSTEHCKIYGRNIGGKHTETTQTVLLQEETFSVLIRNGLKQ